MIGFNQVSNGLSFPVWGRTTWRFDAPTFKIYYHQNATASDKLLLTIQNNLCIIKLEHSFGIVYHERGLKCMSKNEIELFDVLHENDNDGLSVLIAIKVFSAFLERLAEDPTPPAVCPLESA